jgi:multidrug resistance efflux pump
MSTHILAYPQELLTFLIGIIGILSVLTTTFRWKWQQVQNDTQRRTNISNDTYENHKDINQLKETMLRLEIALSELRSELQNRVSTLEGEFRQHSRESHK